MKKIKRLKDSITIISKQDSYVPCTLSTAEDEKSGGWWKKNATHSTKVSLCVNLALIIRVDVKVPFDSEVVSIKSDEEYFSRDMSFTLHPINSAVLWLHLKSANCLAVTFSDWGTSLNAAGITGIKMFRSQ